MHLVPRIKCQYSVHNAGNFITGCGDSSRFLWQNPTNCCSDLESTDWSVAHGWCTMTQLLSRRGPLCFPVIMYPNFSALSTWMMWISFSLQKACSKTLCIWSAALPWLLCGIMQKSALSGSTSSNLIAGISPHVRRFSVWAFLKTVTTALHSDFLFTTQEKHPLLTCIALKSVNVCTQTWYGIIASHMYHCPAHYTRGSQTHLNTHYYTRWSVPTTDRLDLIYLSFAPAKHCAILRHTADGSMVSMNVRSAWRSVTLPWNRDFYTHIIRLR